MSSVVTRSFSILSVFKQRELKLQPRIISSSLPKTIFNSVFCCRMFSPTNPKVFFVERILTIVKCFSETISGYCSHLTKVGGVGHLLLQSRCDQ